MDISENRLIILALKRVITATFTAEKWKELAYLTNTSDEIISHHRLLRSLYWSDEDYPEHVFWAIEMLIKRDPKNLQKIIDFVKPEPWLKENDPVLYAELYSGGNVPLDEIKEAGEILDVAELNRHAERIRKSLDEDFELAIGSTKELLETVFKTVLGYHGQESKKYDLPALWKKIQDVLKLNPATIPDKVPGAQFLKKLFGSLNQIVYSVNEIRNLYGTGHGKAKSKELDKLEAKLVVNSGVALATYILEKWNKGRKNES